MTDFYCGAKKVPKNKRRGTMKECADAGKISYYGVKKVDPRLVEVSGVAKRNALNKDKLKVKIVTAHAKIKKLESNIKDTKDAKKKKQYEDDLKSLKKEHAELLAKFTALNKAKIEPKKATKKKGGKK